MNISRKNLAIAFAPAALASFLLASPTSGQWIEPQLQGWASLTVYRLDTNEQFGPSGEVRNIILDGRAQNVSSFVTIAMGLVPGLDIWIQPSFHRLQFADRDGTRISTGFGDTRIYLRTAPLRLVGVGFPFAIRAGAKLPANLESGTNLIPLGDGQRDWEVIGEVGHSFWPRPFYAAAWAGYRWREATETADFGDERFFNVSVGGDGGLLGFKVQFDGWFGGVPTIGGRQVEQQKREMLRLSPSLLVSAGPGQVELGARLPFAGQNLATGPELVVGYFSRLSF